MLSLRRVFADRHVFDHAPPQRAYGLVGHGGCSCLDGGCEPLITRQDAPARYRLGCVACRSALPRERFSPMVESRCGAVALGRTYLLPPLSSGGASMVPPWLRFHIPLIGRVEDWRAGLGRSLGSLLSRPFVCECPTISTMPRLQPPPRRTQRADFPHCAPPFASRQSLWDLSCWGDFRPVASHSIGVEQP